MKNEKFIMPKGLAFAYWEYDAKYYSVGGRYYESKEPTNPDEWEHLRADRPHNLIMEYYEEIDRPLFEQENELGVVHP